MRRFGLIGYPLSHSFSQKYFTEKFREEGITDASYENFPIRTAEEFPGLVASVKDLAGLNVTIPYKEKILPYLDEVVGEAAAVKATLKCRHSPVASEKVRAADLSQSGAAFSKMNVAYASPSGGLTRRSQKAACSRSPARTAVVVCTLSWMFHGWGARFRVSTRRA